MAFQKGSQKIAGRQKGSTNKITKDLKAMILGALDECGGQDYFVKQAKENPVAFMTLIGKCIPSEIKNNTTITEMPSKIELVDG